MAIKAGQFIHDVHGFVIDRIQTGGVSSLNIPQEKIYELGNYNSVAIVRDIPDLTFDVESFDVSTEVEALIHGIDPTTVTGGQEFNFATTFPLDVISPFKAGNGAFNIVKGIAVPYLNLESVDYKFGVKANASEKFTLRGDAVYYIPGSPYYQSFAVSGTGPYTLSHTALPYVENGNTLYALGVCLRKFSTGAYKRLFFGTGTDGYTNTSTTVTLQTDWSATYDVLHVIYGSAAAATYNASVHQGTSVKPAAVRSKDILVYVGAGGTATSSLVKWGGVQSVDLSRKVNLQNDEEFGNNHYVSSDYDVADVTGSITVRAADTAALWTLVEQITGTNSSAISGPISTTTNELLVKIRDPDSGSTLKTFNVPDARFTLPGASGRVQTKLDVTFQFQSDQGLMSVFKGDIA